MASAEEWARQQFGSAAFCDARLGRRAVRVAAALAAKPHDSIPRACADWGATKGVYRFIDNERVSFESIQKPVARATARVCAERETILAIQDTTSLSFPTARHTEGLGPVTNNTDVRGMHLHSVLATRADGVALGLLDQHVWCRDVREHGKRSTAKRRSIEDKESFKWLRGVRAARAALGEIDEAERPRVIHIGDAESAIHDVFVDIVEAGEALVIRSGKDRRARNARGETGSAHELVGQTPRLAVAKIDVPRKRGRPARRARVEMRATPLTLAPHRPGEPERAALVLTLVEARETDAAQGDKPLHWLVWTTEPVKNKTQALGVIDIYRKRWRVEEVHLALKSGCRIEDVRFHTAQRIAKAIALYSPVAVRIVQLRDLARAEPQAPCTQALSDNEWRALWTFIHKSAPPTRARPPTLRQAVLWIGRLGGHLGRKGDAMPGVRTLWRGWRDLDRLLAMWNSLQT